MQDGAHDGLSPRFQLRPSIRTPDQLPVISLRMLALMGIAAPGSCVVCHQPARRSRSGATPICDSGIAIVTQQQKIASASKPMTRFGPPAQWLSTSENSPIHTPGAPIECCVARSSEIAHATIDNQLAANCKCSLVRGEEGYSFGHFSGPSDCVVGGIYDKRGTKAVEYLLMGLYDHAGRLNDVGRCGSAGTRRPPGC